MKKSIIKLFIFSILLNLILPVARAEVLTMPKTEGNGTFIYVAGSHDMYPFEYYDSKENEFLGIIPAILGKISTLSGIDFAYINGADDNKVSFAENLQAEIVSASEKEEKAYIKEFLEVYSYETGGKEKKIGLAFTSRADNELIKKIKSAYSLISEVEKDSIVVEYAKETVRKNYALDIALIIISILLVATIILLVVKMSELKKIRDIEKITDYETGVGNLLYFKHHYKNTISEVSRDLYYVAYVAIDSSYLRSYHGESSFEEVLKYTATVLTEYAGDTDIVARITENGFVFAFEGINDESAKQSLEQIINRLNEFIDNKEKIVFHSALYHLNQRDKNAEILIFNLRKNCNRIYGTDEQIIFCDTKAMNKVWEEKKIIENILKGFENNEFKMYLQFIVDNKTKKIVTGEALSRWDSPTKGIILPGKYIHNMEKAGLISKHDFYMFEIACRQLEKWSNTEYGDISISCNFTRTTLSEDNFIERLEMIAKSYSFDRKKLAIEITEDVMEKDREIAMENVRKCKELGFSVYLDDLGSGYTTLSNLCDYPVDVVKIDRDILLKTNTEQGKNLFTGIISLVHSLGMRVVSEGVETQAQDALVSSTDCDYIQGWFYSKPVPQDECENFILHYQNNK